MEPNLCAKFQACTYYGFWVTGFEAEQQQQQQQQEAEEELEKWTFCHIFHVSGPILTKS